MEAVVAEPQDGRPPRVFEGHSLSSQGALVIRCGDQATWNWARPILSALPWRGNAGAALYRVTSPADRPRFRTYKVWVNSPGIEGNLRFAQEALVRQNPGFRRDGPWGLRIARCLSSQPTGAHLEIEVDEDLVPELERLGYRASLGIAVAEFSKRGKRDPRDAQPDNR
jgi:hypothetical protein